MGSKGKGKGMGSKGKGKGKGKGKVRRRYKQWENHAIHMPRLDATRLTLSSLPLLSSFLQGKGKGKGKGKVSGLFCLNLGVGFWTSRLVGDAGVRFYVDVSNVSTLPACFLISAGQRQGKGKRAMLFVPKLRARRGVLPIVN
jgi:hypothetical protein